MNTTHRKTKLEKRIIFIQKVISIQKLTDYWMQHRGMTTKRAYNGLIKDRFNISFSTFSYCLSINSQHEFRKAKQEYEQIKNEVITH